MGYSLDELQELEDQTHMALFYSGFVLDTIELLLIISTIIYIVMRLRREDTSSKNPRRKISRSITVQLIFMFVQSFLFTVRNIWQVDNKVHSVGEDMVDWVKCCNNVAS